MARLVSNPGVIAQVGGVARSGLENAVATLAEGWVVANTTDQLANAFGAAALGTLFFEVAKRQAAHVPSEIFGPAFLAVLAVMVGLLLLVAFATRIIPADAHVHAAPGAH